VQPALGPFLLASRRCEIGHFRGGEEQKCFLFAVLADAAAVDRLVKALEANKALLPPIAKKEEAAN
jgi:hypothetical protein